MRDPNEMAAAECEEELIEVGNKLNAIQYRSKKGDEMRYRIQLARRAALRERLSQLFEADIAKPRTHPAIPGH